MTQEEKELLLKDLCARSPYGVICRIGNYNGKLTLVCPNGDYCIIQNSPYAIETVKPYLRPMSSMTEEEKKEFESFGWRVDELDDNYPWVHIGQIENVLLGLNWLNANHFDYRGLIEKGLALEAPKGMYNIKEK